MAAEPCVERLTPLDMLMPRTYIAALLTFKTTESVSTITQPLQRGLDRLCKQLPWLSGHVLPTNVAPSRKPGIEVRWEANGHLPVVANRGSVSARYESLSAAGMPPTSIPEDVWPVPSMIDDALFPTGAPVLAASVFQFSDGHGVGLCVCMHHNAVDATGFAEVLRLWAQNLSEAPAFCSPTMGEGRVNRLSRALAPDLNTAPAVPLNALIASHPEFSTSPPALPTSFDPCTCRLFNISLRQINAVKERIAEHTLAKPSTNSVLCALLWSAITRVREQRNPALASETSQLVTAIDGRRQLGKDFSSPETPYLGNIVTYALARQAVASLSTSVQSDLGRALASLCDSIAQAQSAARDSFRHVSEAYNLADRIDDYKKIFPGWDLFGSRDLTITSWANLDMYSLDFGPQLNKPHFVRVRAAQADGVGLILPRRSASGATGVPGEVLDVMLMLRKDDMDALEQDTMWKGLGN